MNSLFLPQRAVTVVPIVPTIMELFRRKDQGTREIAENITHDEKSRLSNLTSGIEGTKKSSHLKDMGKKIRIIGDINIPSDTQIGSECIIDGHILLKEKVVLGSNMRVRGITDSSENIILKEKIVVEGGSAKGNVRIYAGAKAIIRVPKRKLIQTYPASLESVESTIMKSDHPENKNKSRKSSSSLISL